MRINTFTRKGCLHGLGVGALTLCDPGAIRHALGVLPLAEELFKYLCGGLTGLLDGDAVWFWFRWWKVWPLAVFLC